MQLPPLPTEHPQIPLQLTFDSSTSHNHIQQQVQQPQYRRRKRRVKMSHFTKAFPIVAPTRPATILDLPKELHLKIFYFLNPIDGTCLSLACTVLYNSRPHFTTNHLLFTFVPNLQIPDLPPSPLPLNTGSPFSRHPVVQARGCKFCLPVLHYPAHCELHFHIQEFMVEGMKYCAQCRKFTYSLADVKQGKGKRPAFEGDQRDDRGVWGSGFGGGFDGEMGRSHYGVSEREGKYEVDEIEDIDMEYDYRSILLPFEAAEINSAISMGSQSYTPPGFQEHGANSQFPSLRNFGGAQQNQQALPPQFWYGRNQNSSPELDTQSHTRLPTQTHSLTHGMHSQLHLPSAPQQYNPSQRRPNAYTGAYFPINPPPYQSQYHPSHSHQYHTTTSARMPPPNYAPHLPDPPSHTQHIPAHVIRYHCSYEASRSSSPDVNEDCAETCGTCRVPYNKRFERGRRMLDLTRPEERQTRIRRWYNRDERLRVDENGDERSEDDE